MVFNDCVNRIQASPNILRKETKLAPAKIDSSTVLAKKKCMLLISNWVGIKCEIEEREADECAWQRYKFSNAEIL
jgi:hypothetical protein